MYIAGPGPATGRRFVGGVCMVVVGTGTVGRGGGRPDEVVFRVAFGRCMAHFRDLFRLGFFVMMTMI